MNKEKTQKKLDEYNSKLDSKMNMIKLLVNDMDAGKLTLIKNSWNNEDSYYIEKSNTGSIRPDIVLIRKKLQELSNIIISDYKYYKLKEE